MANVATKNTEVGIIGQMYEERKSKKVGVLESREEKYKTLMMRDKDGKSFNITYSTFRSNWRKYSGKEVVQTSTQVEEKRTEEKKREKKSKKVVENKSEVVRLKTEEKVKLVRATEDIVDSKVKKSGISDLKVSRTCKGGIVVSYKRNTMFEVWNKFNLDKYDIFFRGVVADTVNPKELAKSIDAEFSIHEDWTLKYAYRVKQSNLESAVDALIEVVKNYLASKEEKTEEELK